MLKLEHREGRILLRLRVSPRARRERVAGEHGGALKLYVKEPPEKGRANEDVVRVLAAALGITRGEIELVSGHASQDKRVAISGVDEATLRRTLEQNP